MPTRPPIIFIYKDLKARHIASAKPASDKLHFPFFLYRYLSFFPTAMALKCGFSAHATSIVGLLTLLVSFVLLSQGAIVAGAVVYAIAYIIDFIDGNIARYNHAASPFGSLLDGLIDSLTFLLFFSLASGLSREMSSHSDMQSVIINLGLLASFGFLFRVMLHSKYALHLKMFAVDVTPKKQTPKTKGIDLVLVIKSIANGCTASKPILLVIAALSDLVIYFLLFYACFYILYTSLEVVLMLRKIRSLSKK